MTDVVADEALMARYQQGDQTAFRELFERHKKGVYNYIFRFTGSTEESQEAFQEVFVKLHRAALSYEPTAKFTTWLFTIVRNLCIDHYRRKKLRRHVSLDETRGEGDDFSLYDVTASDDPAPEDQSSDREIARVLQSALLEINEDQREVFLMREKQGLKFEEIAEVLQVSINTVKSRMRYAMEALRKYLIKSGYADLDPNFER